MYESTNENEDPISLWCTRRAGRGRGASLSECRNVAQFEQDFVYSMSELLETQTPLRGLR